MNVKLTSSAFGEGQTIPKKYTCEGQNVSPPLSWDGVPLAAKSLALISDDPDAPVGTWVHWVIYNIPVTISELIEAISPVPDLPGIGLQGKNDFRKIGYGGPCPPPGKTHRYFFKLYALDIALNLPKGSTKQDLEKMMEGHVLAQGQLVGTYRR